MTVDEMRHRMSSEEFLYWRMYYARKAQKQQLDSRKKAR